MPRRPLAILAYPAHRNGARVRTDGAGVPARARPLAHTGWRGRAAALWSTWAHARMAGAREWRSRAMAGSAGKRARIGRVMSRFDLPCDRPLPEHTRWERARLWLPDHPDVPLVEAQVMAPGRSGAAGCDFGHGRHGHRHWSASRPRQLAAAAARRLRRSARRCRARRRCSTALAPDIGVRPERRAAGRKPNGARWTAAAGSG